MATDTFVVNASGKNPTIEKDPGTIVLPVILDYTLDLTTWLDDVGDVLAASNLQSVTLVSDGGGEIDAAKEPLEVTLGPTVSGKTIVVWLKGGYKNEKVAVTINFVTTNSPPRKDERTFFVKMKER